ncbi:MAG: transketolase C-terminal domain-containing protein [Candidatus Latescibacterota bacterium]|nr:transketolase C-terminal domain-containing protein [Candidatus Latescibacterota bacterium]
MTLAARITNNLVAQRDVFGDTLLELIDEDPRVYVLDGDLANSTKADKISRERPEHFLEMGIAEQNMMGVAAGLASCGLIPWLSSFACFLVNRDLDQLRVVVAQPNLSVKIAGAYSGLLTGKTGKTHQEVSDIAVMRAMPNLTVLAPADGVETRLAMRAANSWEGPVYIRLTRDPHPTIFPNDYDFSIGSVVPIRDGSDVTIFATGVQTVRALEAAQQLEGEGISSHVVHVPTLKPLDEAGVIAAAERTGKVITAEDHTVIGGLGGAVAEVLGEQRPTPMKRLGIDDTFGESAANNDLLSKYGLTPEHVAATAQDLVKG